MMRSTKLRLLHYRDNRYIRIQLHSCKGGTLGDLMSTAMKLDKICNSKFVH